MHAETQDLDRQPVAEQSPAIERVPIIDAEDLFRDSTSSAARERYSIPFFFNPAADCKVRPLPSVIGDENPARYDPVEWVSFRGKRYDGDYADYGSEVQIYQYRR